MVQMLRTRIVVWGVGALAVGMAIGGARRISLVVAPAGAAATLLIGTGLIALYDGVMARSHRGSHRLRERRPSKVKALAIAVVVASVIIGLILGAVAILLSVLEPSVRVVYQQPGGGGGVVRALHRSHGISKSRPFQTNQAPIDAAKIDKMISPAILGRFLESGR